MNAPQRPWEICKFEAKTVEAPRIPSFFKGRRAKEFNYKPWYYDAAKEESKPEEDKQEAEPEEKPSEGWSPGW